MMKNICKFIADYMGILVLAVSIAALLWPEVLGQIKPTVINPLLGLVMFGMGLTLHLEDFRIVFSRPKDVITGCLAQFTVMPLLAWALGRIFSLDEALAVGVILVGCCPGGTASNVITYLAKGDLALSVGMTGVSTLLAPLLTPLLVWLLAGKSVDVDVVSMFLSILWVVILPIVAGLAVKQLWPRQTERAVDYLPALLPLAVFSFQCNNEIVLHRHLPENRILLRKIANANLCAHVKWKPRDIHIIHDDTSARCIDFLKK